jgi:hypothetical protein
MEWERDCGDTAAPLSCRKGQRRGLISDATAPGIIPPDRTYAVDENDPVRPLMRRFSRWSSAQSRSPHCETRHARAAPDQGVNHLQGNWQAARRPDLLGHTKVGSTIRDLGVDVEDAFDLEGM